MSGINLIDPRFAIPNNADINNADIPNCVFVDSDINEFVADCPVVRAVKIVISKLIGVEILFQKAQYTYCFHQKYPIS